MINVTDGIFEATFTKGGEKLFARMELLTEHNASHWTHFKNMTRQVASTETGILPYFVIKTTDKGYPEYNNVTENATGFTLVEYTEFINKIITIKQVTDGKITFVLKNNSIGSNHMTTSYKLGESNYIIYITKNPHFSIQLANEIMNTQQVVLKKYIDAYQDILIAVGSDFSSNYDSFHNRGIFRNPYWVFEGKYSGLSMLLHGFSGLVASSHFPEKQWMLVKPVGSMQTIICKNLQAEEGYVEKNGEKFDLTTIEASAEDSEGEINYIKVSALVRIYFETTRQLNR